MRVYFDNAATTPLDPEAINAMTDCMKHHFGNPSSIHSEGRKARAIIEEARKTVAKSLNASIGEIFFTSGGTESNNMGLKCAVRDLGVQRIISSPIEHHCVLHTLEALHKFQNVQIDFLNVDQKGRIDLNQLESFLTDNTKKTLVSLMHANNEIGTMINLEKVAFICQKHGAFFHSDTVQTIGHFPIDVSKLKINFLSGAAHKFHGPKGVGFIYINNCETVHPFIDGGSQERNMRGGTENVYGIVGLAKALELANARLEERKSQILSVKDHLKQRLSEAFDGVEFNGDEDHSLYTVLSVSFPPSPKADLLLFSLDINGVSASGGSACSSGADEGSHVLTALENDPERKTIRFSFSHLNTIEEADFVIDKLKSILPAKQLVTH